MRLAVLILVSLVLAAPAAAQPRVINGTVEALTLPERVTRAAVERLAGGTGAAWIGYAVPAADGHGRACCWTDGLGGCCQACALEGGASSGVAMSQAAPAVVALEPSLLHVLLRVEAGRVDRVRVFSQDCALDAGGRTVRWLRNIAPGDSVALLASLLTPTPPTRVVDGTLMALALHREPAALERLLGAARAGETTHLRGQALFWLAQRAGDKAIGAISDAITNDPDTDVKRRAVFALSQLPHDEGVPRLIQVARTHSNPAVRRQAMFWLGQTRDPRALRFFEEILFK